MSTVLWMWKGDGEQDGESLIVGLKGLDERWGGQGSGSPVADVKNTPF